MFGISLTDLLVISIVVLGVIALGEILKRVLEVLLAAAGTLLVVYVTGVVAALLCNVLFSLPLFSTVLLSWVAVLTKVLAAIC